MRTIRLAPIGENMRSFIISVLLVCASMTAACFDDHNGVVGGQQGQQCKLPDQETASVPSVEFTTDSQSFPIGFRRYADGTGYFHADGCGRGYTLLDLKLVLEVPAHAEQLDKTKMVVSFDQGTEHELSCTPTAVGAECVLQNLDLDGLTEGPGVLFSIQIREMPEVHVGDILTLSVYMRWEDIDTGKGQLQDWMDQGSMEFEGKL